MREGWVYKKLGEICEIERGGSPRPIQQYITDDEDGLNWIKIGDAVDGSKYINSTKEKIIKEGLKKTRFVHKGDFILSNSMSFGKPYILGIDGCIHDGWLVIRDTHNHFDKSFLYYLLGSPNMYNEFKRLAVGGVVNNLNSQLVRNVSVALPPLSEQQRIVSELDLLSSIIDKKKAQLKEYDQLAQSIFYEMFGDPVSNEKGWEVKSMGEIGTIGTGATPNRKKEDLYYGGDINWVKTTEVHNCEIINTEETITQLAIEETNCKIYPPNTLLMAMYGQGKTRGQIAKLKIRAATNQACAAIMLDEKVSNLDFIYTLLLIKYEDIRAMAQGGNQANLNMKLVGAIPIIIPSLELQIQFASKMEAIERQKALVQQSITEAETLFNSRMDFWFS